MSVHSHEAASDETDRLCDDTIELIGSFGRMLAKARAARTAAAASPACPCGRSVERHQQNHNPAATGRQQQR
ncbi:hypothetical protein BOX15_Mlig014705g1 [Macrostomum lignano]|uniref:Uncharacterized protein n=1 Tax=Macrostomum lignano TaxID=282301 RepID=A0A267GWN8_9PLAT|nr:hypothetical protein BOX15_Mlig014705g1 [Macrostomum lignano]